MKIIFFGTPEFAATNLESLAKDPDIEILAVITQPDQKVGRKQVLTAPPAKQTAESLNLKVLQPKNKKELLDILKKIQADFFVVIAYGVILTTEILELPVRGAINVHPSLLPKYRGATPVQESLLHGDEETGISIIKIDSQMDHGNILLIRRLSIDKKDNLPTLSKKLANLSAKLLPHVLKDFNSGELKPIAQNHSQATFCKKIERENGKINFTKTAEEIQNMLRAYTPWPGIYTELDGRKLKILDLETSEEKNEPGKFIFNKKELKIGTKSGTILPKIVQLEGKTAMSVEAFLSGYKK